LREQRARLSKNSDTTKAINYSFNRWDAFTRFLEDGRLCMSNNAAERELRAVALGQPPKLCTTKREGSSELRESQSIASVLTTVTSGAELWLRKLAEPTITPTGKRIPGLKLDHPAATRPDARRPALRAQSVAAQRPS
jgi:transposase